MIHYHCPNELRKGTDQAAGYDLISTSAERQLSPRRRYLISTELYLALPRRTYAMICSRSGLALHHGVVVLNAPGIVDADYRGEVQILLANLGDTDYMIRPGDRIAQVLFMDHMGDNVPDRSGVYPEYGVSDDGKLLRRESDRPLEEFLDRWPTLRGEAGHGSTGR